MTCILCGNAAFRTHEVQGLAACAKCGLVRRSTFPEQREAIERYRTHAGYAAGLSSAQKALRRSYEAKRRWKLIRPYMPENGVLLEIGSHEGMLLREAETAGFSAYGIEPNTQAFSSAVSSGRNVFGGTFESYAADKTFDVITAFHVLEHLYDPYRALEKAALLLRPGGVIVLETPDITSYAARGRGSAWPYITDEHLFYFSPETLRGLLAKAGFRVVALRQRDFDLPHSSIGELLRRLGFGHARAKGPPASAAPRKNGSQQSGLTRFAEGTKAHAAPLARRALVLLVRVLRRGDFMFVVARKLS